MGIKESAQQTICIAKIIAARILPACPAKAICDRRENVLRKISNEKIARPTLHTRLLAEEFPHLSMRSNTFVWRMDKGLIRKSSIIIN